MPPTWPVPQVTIGFATNPGETFFQLDVSLLDGEDVLAGPDDGMTNISYWLDGDTDSPIHIARGRSGPRSDYERATCEIAVRNDGGRFDPQWDEGPYTVGGATLVKTGRRVTVAMLLPSGRGEARFGGQVEAYRPDLSDPDHPKMVIECSGRFAVVARVDPEASTPTGDGELSGDRQHRLLDIALVPDSDREIAAGLVPMQPTTTAQNILTEARATAASESPLGGFYENRFGRLQHDGRRDLLERARSATPRAVLGPSATDGNLPYVALEPLLDKDLLANDISTAAAGGTAVRDEDATSVAENSRYTDKRTDLLFDDPTGTLAAQFTEWGLGFFGQPHYRYASITVDLGACPDSSFDDLAELMATLEIRDRLGVREVINYPGDPHDDTSEPFTLDTTTEQFVERIEEWIGFEHWVQQITPWSAEPFAHIFQLDVSLLDGEDVLAPL